MSITGSQSFRLQLVEWLREIVPYNQIEKYTKKRREGIDTSPFAGRRANHVNYLIVTAKHSYSISANPGYLGCIASTTFYRPGENWTRGNDLPDGKFTRETWEAIKDAIIRYELLKIEPERTAKADGIPGPPAVENTPAQEELYAAQGEMFRSQQRLARAERAVQGLDKNDPEMPTDRAVVEAGADE